MKSVFLIDLFLICLSIDATFQVELKPNGKNVCSETITSDVYVVKTSAYVGYENYMTCCGLFCWSKCQKSRPVRREYTKAVKTQVKKTVYSCCKGWVAVNDECTHPICQPTCMYGNCISPDKCKCLRGFNGTRCDHDINECLQTPPVCDHVCQNIDGSYVCTCKKGFQKSSSNTNEPKCINVNECSLSSSLCKCADPQSSCQATCQDTIGSYKCECSKGYKLTANSVCVDSNECGTGKHGCQHYCYNANGKYSCSCKIGYILDQFDEKSCHDINECSFSNGGCEQTCINLPGTFKCSCRTGFQLLYDNSTCQDINECTKYRPCDPTRGLCQNTRGSYKCSCKQGFALDRDGILCEDIDECATNLHGCNHKCNNLIGSYECECTSGYKLDADKSSCIDIDECLLGNNGCEHICTNVLGSYTCSCTKGFILSSNGKSCSALPCNKLQPIPYANLQCNSTQPGSICFYECWPGYELSGDQSYKCLEGQLWSGKTTSCQAKACPVPHAPLNGMLMLPCHQKFGSRCIVYCPHGYSLEGVGFLECGITNGTISWNVHENKCTAVQLCQPNPCQNGGRCVILSHTSYRCDCKNTGYIGESCSLGLIEMPSLPSLPINTSSELLTIRAHPSREIIIIPNIPNRGISFVPNVLKISHPNTEITFRLHATDQAGRMRIYFNVSGESSSHFIPPLSMVTRVISANHPGIERLITSDRLIKQCHSKKIATCEESAEDIFLHSSCPWEKSFTKGHISVGTNSLRLPFSISGFTVPNIIKGADKQLFSPRSNVVESLRTGIANCTMNTCDNHLTKHEFHTVLRTNLFIKSYLQQLNGLSPWFLHVSLDPNYNGFDVSNFQSLAFRGEVPYDMPSCPNLPKLDRGMYSIITSKSSVDLTFMSSTFKVRGLATSCIVINLCNNVFYMSLPLTDSVDATENLHQSGFQQSELILSGLSISKGEIVQRKCMKTKKAERCVGGNIWAKFSLLKRKDHFNFTFDGDVVINVTNVIKLGLTRFDEPYEAIAEGSFDLSLRVPIGGSSLIIQVSDPNTKALKTSDGSSSGTHEKDGIRLTTKNSNIRFIYQSPLLTFKPASQVQDDDDSIAEVYVKYLINGGSVIEASNQAKIRMSIGVILGNVDGLYVLIVRYQALKVAGTFLLELKTDLVSLSNKLRLPLDYKSLMNEAYQINMKLQSLRDVLENIILQVKIDSSLNSVIAARCLYVLSFLDKQDITPMAKTMSIKEEFKGFQSEFVGEVCLHKICVRSCLLETSMSVYNPAFVFIKCTTNEDQFLRSKIKLEKHSIVRIKVSATSNHFEMNFPVIVSAHLQSTPGKVFVNESHFVCLLNDFSLSDGILSNVTINARLDSTSTWKHLLFTLHGASDHNANFSKHLEAQIKGFLKENANDIDKKLQTLSNHLNTTTYKLQDSENKKINSTNILKQLEHEVRQLEQNLRISKTDLDRSRIRFKSYQVTPYLQNYNLYLDAKCKLKECPKVCMATTLCNICEGSLSVDTQVLKCKDVKKKVRITQEEEYDSACHELKTFYKQIYTGTCQGGGDPTEMREFLPNWGAGIGNTIGGPVGALIGGLAGAVVGQFFEGCEDTWSNVMEKELVTVPCKKLRLRSVEQEWVESECLKYENEFMTTYSAPKVCNCTSECIDVQDSQCLVDNRNCMILRKEHMKGLLQTASVYEPSASEFLDFEEKVTVMENALEKAIGKLKSHASRHEQTLVAYSQLLQYKKRIATEIWVLNDKKNIDSCLASAYRKLQEFAINTIRFGPAVSIDGDINFDVDASVDKKKVTSNVLINILDIRVNMKNSIDNIVTQIFCPELLWQQKLEANTLFYAVRQQRTFSTTFSKADTICNTILGYYSYIRHVISSIKTMATDAQTKWRTTEEKILITKNKLKDLQSATKTEISNSNIDALEKQLVDLVEEKRSYEPSNVLDYWHHDMEEFNKKAHFLQNYGFEDTVEKIFNKFNELASLSGVDESYFYNALTNLRNIFAYLQDYRRNPSNSSADPKALDTVAFGLYYTFAQMWNKTKFCFQTLIVTISKPPLVTALVGDKITFKCDVNTNKSRKYYWYYNQKEISWEHTEELRMNVAERHEGLYRCKIETLTQMNISNDVYLSVESKPSIVEHPQDIVVLPSEQLRKFVLSCNVSGVPMSNISWHYLSYDGVHNITLVTNQSVLNLPQNGIRQGHYYCTAGNKHGVAHSRLSRLDVLRSCIASQVFILSLSIPRNELNDVLNRIFYSESASKAWSTSPTQIIFLAVKHENNELSKVFFKMSDPGLNDTNNRCMLDDRTMLSLVSDAKANMVQLLKNVLATLSVKTDESMTIAEIRENLRSTLLLEPAEVDFCPRGYQLHKSQYKCVQCQPGTFESDGHCKLCYRGTYQSNSGAVDCDICPIGTLTKVEGAVGPLDCNVRFGGNLSKYLDNK